MEFRKLFEKDYAGYEVILDSLVKPIFGGKIQPRNQDIEPEPQDAKFIKNMKIFATHSGLFSINFVDVTIKDNVKLEHNRVTVQRCVRKLTPDLTSALIFFHYENTSNTIWRITFVNKGEKASDSTNPKRYTYLCGNDLFCRTADERFSVLKSEIASGNKILDELMINAFSVESIGKEFFDQYREHYADLVEYISGKRFVKKNGKFVEEKTKNANGAFKEAFGGDDKAVRDYVKKMMGRLVFLQFLQKKGWLGVKKGEQWGSGDKNFIYNLFHNADENVKKDFLKLALEPLFFNSLNNNRGEDAIAPKAICDIYGEKIRIPYLNGGLFEEDELDKKKVKFKKEHFEALLEFFNQYNFTIDETDPDDTEIGVDPEMLGKIFENLLEDNKDKGAFYTPKEIVQYMCQESLIAYLVEKLPEEDKIRKFVLTHEHSFTEKEKADIYKALLDVKICDPAVGSGAFPMGMLNELLSCSQALVGDTKTRAELKKHIVKNNIYGVDIEKGAVDIARLRFWLAIIVDEENPLPLPNLDYKIMQGNSLLESFEGVDLSNLCKLEKGTLFNAEKEVNTLVTTLSHYFDTQNHEERDAHRTAIREAVFDLLKARNCGNENEILSKLKTIDLHENNQFFLWHTWFSDVFNRRSDCNGFDIVIGNPPYIDSETMTNNGLEWERKLLQKTFNNLSGNWDIYMAFFELGLSIGKILSFITPDKWLSKGFGLKFRENQVRSRLSMITRAGSKVFESATIDAIITLFSDKSDILNAYEFVSPTEINRLNSKIIKNIEKPFLIDFMFSQNSALIDKLDLMRKHIKDYCLCEGACATSDFYIVKELIEENSNPDFKTHYKLINTGTIGKYCNKWSSKQISYDGKFDFPTVNRESFKKKLGQTYVARAESSKIIFKGLNLLDVCLDECAEILPGKSTMVICSQNIDLLKFLMGLLNSPLPIFYIKNKYSSSSYCGGITFTKNMIDDFPLEATDDQMKPIIELVNEILEHKKTDPEFEIQDLQNKINDLVYQIYCLTEEEIRIIES